MGSIWREIVRWHDLFWKAKSFPRAKLAVYCTLSFKKQKTRFVLLWAFEISWLSMTFSMTYVKQLFSEYCQNNLLVKVFSHITWRIKCLLVFVTGINRFSDLSVVFSTFDFLCLVILRTFIAFPWPTRQFQDFSGFENEVIKLTFQAFHDPYEPWVMFQGQTEISEHICIKLNGSFCVYHPSRIFRNTWDLLKIWEYHSDIPQYSVTWRVYTNCVRTKRFDWL